MQYRRLGQTSIYLSLIGFGASALGNVFGEVSTRDGQEAVECAIDRGITFFDVSPYYGYTKAEERLGKLLTPHRKDVVLATKCGRYGIDRFDFSAATIVKEFEESLRRLRTDRVELLQAHDIEFGNIDEIVNETIPAMRRLQEQGKVGAIGLTSYWPGLLAKVAEQTRVEVVLNYCHGNLFMDDMSLRLEPLTSHLGIGLINASPLHMGLLGGGKIPSWHPAPEEVRAAARDVVALCRHFGEEPARVALWACLTNEAPASTLIGMSNKKEVETSCSALEASPNPALVTAIRSRLRPVLNTVWPSGVPENSDPLPSSDDHGQTPQGVSA